MKRHRAFSKGYNPVRQIFTGRKVSRRLAELLPSAVGDCPLSDPGSL
jgi:hypothetical protein